MKKEIKERIKRFDYSKYGGQGAKTDFQCYWSWRRKYVCILRGIKDHKNNFGFADNIEKETMLNWCRKFISLIEIDLGSKAPKKLQK